MILLVYVHLMGCVLLLCYHFVGYYRINLHQYIVTITSISSLTLPFLRIYTLTYSGSHIQALVWWLMLCLDVGGAEAVAFEANHSMFPTSTNWWLHVTLSLLLFCALQLAHSSFGSETTILLRISFVVALLTALLLCALSSVDCCFGGEGTSFSPFPFCFVHCS